MIALITVTDVHLVTNVEIVIDLENDLLSHSSLEDTKSVVNAIDDGLPPESRHIQAIANFAIIGKGHDAHLLIHISGWIDLRAIWIPGRPLDLCVGTIRPGGGAHEPSEHVDVPQNAIVRGAIWIDHRCFGIAETVHYRNSRG